MTYIHSDHRTFSVINLVLAGMIFTAFIGVFWLVALYNNVVNLNHNVAAAKAKLDSVGAETTALNGEVAAALGVAGSNALADTNGLVQDNHPQYFSNHQSPEWPIASQQ
jgi:hypothetical protein